MGALRTTLVALLFAGCGVPIDPARPPLRVGTSGDYAPFSQRTPTGDDIEGLDLDVARRFARDTGRRLEIVPFRWPELTTALREDAFDVAMSGVTTRAERALVGTFTRPIVDSGAVLLVRTGLASTPEDVDRQGVRLAVNRGGHLERVARRMFAQAHIETVDDNTSLPAMLAVGAVDAIVCDQFEAAGWRATVSPNARVLGPFTVDHKAYLAREPALAVELDTWMRAREVDGTLPELRRRWLGVEAGGTRSGIESDVDALLALIDLRLAFMPWVAAAKLVAGLPIVDPAQEEQVLATARQDARTHGIDSRSAVALFAGLITAARSIQTAYAALPASSRPTVETADLTQTLRPAIAALSRDILQRASDVARESATVNALPAAALARHLDPSLTPPAERDRIANAVRGLKPSSDRSPPPADR